MTLKRGHNRNIRLFVKCDSHSGEKNGAGHKAYKNIAGIWQRIYNLNAYMYIIL
jgi:hypothetical protein